MNWLIGHLVADYLLQNDWMGFNKKDRWLPCIVHCLIYTVCLAVFTGWPFWALVLVFLSHMFFDRTKFVGWYMLKMNRRPRFMEPPYFPWSWIVVDNTFHLLSLFLIEILVKGKL